MTTQAEQILENSLVTQLIGLGYEKTVIRDEKDLTANLKKQLEKHNQVRLSAAEFRQVLNFLGKGNIYRRARVLRDRVPYLTDTGDKKTLELINQIHWCQNEFQVTQQITMTGKRKNRYDVTILINGLPLVQIELKRRGLELKEAFNQINRYERHSFGTGYGLFQFVQLFVVSNGVNTKYFANNPVKMREFKQTFYWATPKNKLITQLSAFADVFLEPCHLSKMITKYVVLNETAKMLMILRPYQFYAVEAIIERVKTTSKFGYVWHTTGSGKTLTSFKASQILTNLPGVHKVVFVVDRKDLDYQTSKEFNSFSKGSIDGTTDTRTLVQQLTGDNKLIVTTIQKLNTAVSKKRYLGKMADLQRERIVFIFDECHRSQFGKTHEAIKNFFPQGQMFGFTGTPIFKDNAGTNEYGKRTTKMLFGKCLHKYVITDAIRDENVLKFSVEYIRTFKQKEGIQDIDVEAIDKAEVMNAPVRQNAIVDYIIANHDRKTHSRKFAAIFCVSHVAELIKYYRLFQSKKTAGGHDLRVATIFSYQTNESDQDALGYAAEPEDTPLPLAAEPEQEYQTQHSRDALEDFMADYNAMFGGNYSTRDSKLYYAYYNNIAKRVKAQQIDILLVVNMFLTGFDSKHLNTLYVDKNLRYHGLIQAYSRTNRIIGDLKSQGNIVSFRNLKAATDEAITLFSNLAAKDEIIMQPYEDYVEKFNKAFIKLLQITPTVNSVNDLVTEEDEAEFVKAFRELMRVRNVLKTFTEFTYDDIAMPEQSFEDYKSKYLDIFEKTKSKKEKVSILGDLDFELELIHRDEINVTYIIRLLEKLKDAAPEDRAKQEKVIIDILVGDTQLRSKRELIEKFIANNLPALREEDDVSEAFETFWDAERKIALAELSDKENLNPVKLEKVIGDYLFTEKTPLRDEVIGMMETRPALKERGSAAERVIEKVLGFVEVFVSGVLG